MVPARGYLRRPSLRLYLCHDCRRPLVSHRVCSEPLALVATCPFLYECPDCDWACHELDLFGERGVKFAF